jgi:hypothetical protein
MKYTIYEDPLTHKFALLPLPNRFVDGDTLPLALIDQWFASREAAIAALPELLDREECDAGGRSKDVPDDGGGPH